MNLANITMLVYHSELQTGLSNCKGQDQVCALPPHCIGRTVPCLHQLVSAILA